MDIYLVTKGPKGSFRTYVGSLELDGVQCLEDMLNVGFKFTMSATDKEITAAGREVELHPMPFEDKDEARRNWHQKMQDFLDKQSEGIVDPPVYDECSVTNHDCYICTALAAHNSGAHPCHTCHSYHAPQPCSDDTRAIVTVEEDGSFRSNKPTLQDFINNVGCDSCAVLAIYPCHLCHSFHNNGPCDAVMELINGKTNSE